MSAKTFNLKFRPQDFKGPLARHIADREDLFQQVVGDLFRELFPERVSVTATKGRDGAIDGFIEEFCDSEESFFGLRAPIIVECKDHDDSLGTVTRNVEAGWQKVKEKLARQAEKGWEGTYEPWRRANGYLYCGSAVLHQQSRDSLTRSIAEFFSSLPPGQKPGIQNVHVLDWGELAALLNRHTRLADVWLGIDLSGIVGQKAYEAGLSGFRLYLKEEKLPLISPAREDPTHPKNLLATLEANASSTGILVVGPGGVGKTRICFEVARLAFRAGWRVLHLLPGEPPVTATALQEVVLQGETTTLLVIDYLDQMGSLDFGTIRHRLIPEAQARGIPVALLANARRGVLHKTNPERDSLFRRIELDIRDRRDRIIAHFQETIAPLASKILGTERVREICGTRPIIGMFIARELERYALEDSLDQAVVSRLRQGDLQGWIRRRFQEDGLLPRETHPLLPASPDPVMVATAAVFSAAPLFGPKMLEVVAATLTATGMEDSAATAEPLIASLEGSGWLEQTGSQLTTPHDVVADELLELTFCDRDRHTVRRGIAEKVLVGALGIPRVLGRLSASLDRVIGQKDFPEQIFQEVKKTVSAWLALHASDMGRAFTTADADEVSYALGAVLTGSAWSEAALMEWDNLIAPWLALNARSGEALHLLYRGLKALPKGAADDLADMAIHWLDGHGSSLEASYIIDPLLSRADLGTQAQAASKAAMDWLQEHGTDPGAGFVLAPLLSRADLGAHAEAALKATMDWLQERGTDPEARFVLAPLLSRGDLGDYAEPALKATMDWLQERGTDPEAQFVLAPLLSRGDLGDYAEPALKATMDWLQEHGTDPGAQFVLAPLLSRADLGAHAEPAIKAATDWLQNYRMDPEAQFVLHSLLSRGDLAAHAEAAVTAAMDWLEFYFLTEGAEFVLKNLLGKSYLSDEGKNRCIALALNRLDKVIESPEATFLLRSCLKERSLSGKERKQAVESALKWLRLHPNSDEMDFVFNRLLRNPTIEDIIWREVADYAVAWLKRNPLAPGRDHALNSLFPRSGCLTPDEKAFLLRESDAWLRAFPASEGRERLLVNLERLNNMDGSIDDLSAAPDQLGISPSSSLSDLLRENVRNGKLPDNFQFERAFKIVHSLLERNRPGAAAYYLSSMLPCTIIKNDPIFTEEVTTAVRLVLCHPAFTHPQRKGFSRTLWRLLDEGAWSNREKGECLLSSLGIHRPPEE